MFLQYLHRSNSTIVNVSRLGRPFLEKLQTFNFSRPCVYNLMIQSLSDSVIARATCDSSSETLVLKNIPAPSNY